MARWIRCAESPFGPPAHAPLLPDGRVSEGSVAAGAEGGSRKRRTPAYDACGVRRFVVHGSAELLVRRQRQEVRVVLVQ